MAWQPYEDHIDGMNLDIRVTESARMTDQKTTRTDVISSIAECILVLTENNHGLEFTVRDLWHNPHSIDVAVNEYNKPNPQNPNADSEYNKFFGQPLNLFRFAGLVEGEKIGRTWHFTVSNRNMLETIAGDTRESRRFLAVYIEKIFRDSGLGTELQNFLDNQDDVTFEAFRDAFYNLLLNNTPLGGRGAGGRHPGRTESRRILNPAINIVANRYHRRGSERGHISTHNIANADLQYNRVNFRDVGRDTELTRNEWDERQAQLTQDRVGAREEARAMQDIQRLYEGVSQYQDEFAADPGQHGRRHHILARAQFPQFRAHTENIITLTSTQHDSFAHNGNFRTIEPIYQAKLLICNSFYIERAIQNGITIYTQDNFVELLNTRYNLDLTPQTSFADLRVQIVIAVDTELHNAGRPEAEYLTNDTITEIERISNTPFRNA